MIGGGAEELRLVALAVEVLAEKFEVCRRPRPALLDDLLRQSATWGRLGPPVGDGKGLGGEDTAVALRPLLLTTGEAAQLTRLSVNTISRAVRDGRLRVVREGRAVRVRPEDLEEFVARLDSGGGPPRVTHPAGLPRDTEER